MRKKIVLTTGVIAVVTLLAVPLAFAQHARRMHADGAMDGSMMLGHLRHAKEALGLSDQQVTDIRAIFQDLHQQNQTYRQSMRNDMHQVMQTLLKNPNDTAAAQALIDQQLNNERAVRTNMVNATAKALNVLTSDQRTKLGTMIQEHMDRRQNK